MYKDYQENDYFALAFPTSARRTRRNICVGLFRSYKYHDALEIRRRVLYSEDFEVSVLHILYTV